MPFLSNIYLAFFIFFVTLVFLFLYTYIFFNLVNFCQINFSFIFILVKVLASLFSLLLFYLFCIWITFPFLCFIFNIYFAK